MGRLRINSCILAVVLWPKNSRLLCQNPPTSCYSELVSSLIYFAEGDQPKPITSRLHRWGNENDTHLGCNLGLVIRFPTKVFEEKFFGILLSIIGDEMIL